MKKIKIRYLLILLLLAGISSLSMKETFFICCKGKTKIIKIPNGQLKVPSSWKSGSDENHIYLFAGKDTLIFTGNSVNMEKPPLKAKLNPSKDTSYISYNHRVEMYNDSVISNNKSFFESCTDIYSPVDSSFTLYYDFPCRIDGTIIANFSIKDGNTVTGVTTTKISSARAAEFIEVLKTLTKTK